MTAKATTRCSSAELCVKSYAHRALRKCPRGRRSAEKASTRHSQTRAIRASSSFLKALHSLEFGISLTFRPPGKTKKAPPGQRKPGGRGEAEDGQLRPAKTKKRVPDS